MWKFEKTVGCVQRSRALIVTIHRNETRRRESIQGRRQHRQPRSEDGMCGLSFTSNQIERLDFPAGKKMQEGAETSSCDPQATSSNTRCIS